MDGLILNCVGFMRIVDKASGEILRAKKNAIHFENMSEALALAFANQGTGHVHEMVFGNGASEIQGTGVLFYRPPNVGGAASLYNQTHQKVVDNQSPLNLDTVNNFIVTRHTPNQNFSDVIITCTLGYNEPAGQEAFDTASGSEGNYVFDELGLKSYHATPGAGKLLTHVVFHPVQKSLNRIIEVQYTIRLSASAPA